MSAGLCEQQQKKSVYRRSYEEVQCHKWIESQKAGFDRGETAISEWVKLHWTGFLRARWVEHLQGKQFWAELYRCDFGLLERKFHECPQLLSEILDQLKAGKENLDVLDWAFSQHIPIEPVLEILEALDVNSSRLQHGFDPEPE
jgi:hypothetical protein